MAYIPKEERRTVIIPVEKDTYDMYTIKVTKEVWNAIQILLLEGAETKGVTLELDYELEDNTK